LCELNIIDLTDDAVKDFFNQLLSPEMFEKLNQPVSSSWEKESSCLKLLNALCKDQVDQRDLCEIIRTPVIESSDYRPLKHYDLRTIENVVGNWYVAV
jgi:hypothetical protein